MANIKHLIKAAKRCTSLFSQYLGLMFHIQQPPLLFEFSQEQKISLHTFFVFYPINIYFLDKNKKVIETATMKPFRFYFSRNKAKYVLEAKSIKDRIK